MKLHALVTIDGFISDFFLTFAGIYDKLAEQFNINKVLAKSKLGLMLRITIKILAHNISFIINHILGNKEISQIKQLVFG